MSRAVIRDKQILKFINKNKFATIDQVSLWLNVSYSVTARRLSKLCNMGFLVDKTIFNLSCKTFFVTSKGIKFSGDSLSGISKINLSTFQHDLRLTTLIHDLSNELNIQFLTEREIKKQLSDEFKHIPDALHITPTNEYIIVELELTKKSKFRALEILKKYRSMLKVQKIYYFFDDNQTKAFIKKLAEELNMSNIIELRDIDALSKYNTI